MINWPKGSKPGSCKLSIFENHRFFLTQCVGILLSMCHYHRHIERLWELWLNSQAAQLDLQTFFTSRRILCSTRDCPLFTSANVRRLCRETCWYHLQVANSCTFTMPLLELASSFTEEVLGTLSGHCENQLHIITARHNSSSLAWHILNDSSLKANGP